MDNKPLRLEILNIKPTHVEVKFLSNNKQVKMAKQFFKKRVRAGLFDIVNHQKMPTVI